MTGLRKVFIVLVIGAIAAFVPLNEHQAEVLIYLVVAAMAGNGLEHIAGGSIRKVLDETSNIRNRIRSVRSVSDPGEIPSGTETGNDH